MRRILERLGELLAAVEAVAHRRVVADATLRADELQPLLVAFDVRSPRGAQHQRGVTAARQLEAHEGRAEVLDIERGGLPVPAACIGDLVARAELGRGRCRDRDRARVIHQPHREVERVHADVADCAAERGGLARERAPAGDAETPRVDRLCEVDRAEVSSIDGLAQHAVAGLEARVLVRHQHHIGLVRGREHALGLVDGGGERLLAEHVRTGLDGAEGDLRVPHVRDTDRDDVRLHLREHRAPVGVDAPHAMLRRKLAGGRFVDVRDGDHLDASARVAGQVPVVGDPSGADDGGARGRNCASHSRRSRSRRAAPMPSRSVTGTSPSAVSKPSAMRRMPRYSSYSMPTKPL